MSIDYNLTAKINASKNLNFNDKAILNEIIAFEKNTNKPFVGSDNYLAEKWGVSLRTIERTISNLKKLEIISSNVVKKKHTEGEKTWYNKRYITVSFGLLTDLVGNSIIKKSRKLEDSNVEVSQQENVDVERKTILTSEPINFEEGKDAGTMAGQFDERIGELSSEQMHSIILKNNSKDGKRSMIDHYLKNKDNMEYDELKWVYDEIMN